MRPAIFLGPSLRRAKAEQLIDADFYPPAARGDIIRAVARDPSAIGLVDGYFKDGPTVLHKEILWAMHCGIPVFGASSIGALRAAELIEYGMIGIGTIFDYFRTGRLNRDDEVAVVHAPMELEFLPLSEALVNIRATVEFLDGRGLLRSEIAARLVQVAQRIFYPNRSFVELCKRAINEGAIPDDDAYLELLMANRVDLKAQDAIELVSVLSRLSRVKSEFPVDWTFEWTEAWDEIYWSSTL